MRPWLWLVLANVLWAGSYVAGKFALRDLSVNMMNALRMILAALLLLPLLAARRTHLQLARRDLVHLAILALVGFVLNKVFEYGGLALTTAADVALLISSESVFTAIFSWLLLRERFRLLTGLSLLLGLSGVYLVVERGLLPALSPGDATRRVAGDLLVIVALLFESLYTVRGKALLARHAPLLVTAAAIVGSAVLWVPLAGIELAAHGWSAPGWQSWSGLLWLALMSTVVANLAWFKGLERVDGSAAASVLFIQPLLGTLLAVLLLGEHVLPTTLLGGALILVSVLVVSRPEKVR